MTPFQEVQDGLVITLQKGIYRQSPLFQRDGYVFAKIGSGFVRLFKGGGTSVPTISWKDYDPGQARITEDSFALVIASKKPPRKIAAKAA